MAITIEPVSREDGQGAYSPEGLFSVDQVDALVAVLDQVSAAAVAA